MRSVARESISEDSRRLESGSAWFCRRHRRCSSVSGGDRFAGADRPSAVRLMLRRCGGTGTRHGRDSSQIVAAANAGAKRFSGHTLGTSDGYVAVRSREPQRTVLGHRSPVRMTRSWISTERARCCRRLRMRGFAVERTRGAAYRKHVSVDDGAIDVAVVVRATIDADVPG